MMKKIIRTLKLASLVKLGFASFCWLLLAFDSHAERVDFTFLVDEVPFVQQTPTQTGDTCKEVVQLNLPDAKTDLANGIVRIYIPGGLVSQANPHRQLMQDRYKIEFWEEGCVRLYDPKVLAAYNKSVFVYLDTQYGQAWRRWLTVDTY